MRCPVCKTTSLQTADLAPELSAFTCPECRGHFIPSNRYWSWLQTRGIPRSVDTPPADPAVIPAAPDAPVADSPPGKLCPGCGHFFRRFAVGHHLAFAIDRCGTCGAFWLDGGEFLRLTSHRLADRLHLLASDAYQAQLAAQARQASHLERLRVHLGKEDFATLQHLKAWLDTHPRRAELYAHLRESAEPAPPRVLHAHDSPEVRPDPLA